LWRETEWGNPDENGAGSVLEVGKEGATRKDLQGGGEKNYAILPGICQPKKIQRGGVNATKKRWELGLKGTESGKFEALCPLLPPAPSNILIVKWY